MVGRMDMVTVAWNDPAAWIPSSTTEPRSPR
jgi:hypothetical protein